LTTIKIKDYYYLCQGKNDFFHKNSGTAQSSLNPRYFNWQKTPLKSLAIIWPNECTFKHI